MKHGCVLLFVVACGGGTASQPDAPGGGRDSSVDGAPGSGPQLAGCPVFPSNMVWNTRIDALPVDANSAAYIATIGGSTKIHLDLGTQTDQQATDFYGIPYNVAHGLSMTWLGVAYYSSDPSLNWNPKPESDCADSSHAMVSPCTIASPMLPIPASPIVEGGINTAGNELPYGDHHLIVLDADACRLWETYHAYSPSAGTWNIFGSASWDLRSTMLRPADWSSSDAAGLPILPLLLRADEASSGTIDHAVRFTITNSKIRAAYVWPARHQANTSTSASDPPMGQLFRLKASYQIPSSFGVQSRAILQAMKTYGMYIADNGSDMYVQGEPSANWADATFSEVQSVTASNFEAVDITAITSRAGFDASSGAVPQ